jgi:hypothetical protein
MNRWLLTLLSLSITLAPPAAAQETGPLVRYGKWVLAAGAVGMNLLAARDHDRAEEAFGVVEDACFASSVRCILGPDGTYADRDIERWYQTSLRYDRNARRWLIAGESVLLGAAALFVWEMTRKTHKPDNIPFEPEVRSLRQATGVGIRISLP